MPAMTFADLRFYWKSDCYRLSGCTRWPSILKRFVADPRYTYVFIVRTCRYLSQYKGHVLLSIPFWCVRLLLHRYSYKWSIEIPWGTEIGPGLQVVHCSGIVISVKVRLGRNCTISQGVTLGLTERGLKQGAPVVGDDVYIGPGAKIIGNVHVGNNVAIGANCVVTGDVSDNAVVVGVPGKTISFAGAAEYVKRTDYTRKTA